MDSPLGDSNNSTASRAEERPLRLLTELRPWHHVFLENLRDTVLARRAPHVWTTSPPGKFWSDVFVPGGMPWVRLGESGVLHVLAVIMLVTFTRLYFTLEQRSIHLKPQSAALHYEVSEYLPPINTSVVRTPKPRHGAPLLAKQKILSLPPRPDNFEQTIVSPVDVKLPSNIPLPNIVAWTPVPAAPVDNPLPGERRINLPPVPVIAPPAEVRDLNRRVPQMAEKVIPPAPEAANLDSNRKLDANASVMGPPPTADPAKLRTPRNIIAVTPSVIEPPPAENLSHNLSAMNAGKLMPTVTAPKLPVAEQRAIALAPGKPGQASGRTAQAAVAPPPPALQGALPGGSVAGQLIALNLHPANMPAPANVPPGRRSGEFAAGPEGKPNAPGTPDIKSADGAETGTAGTPNSKGIPPGIVVGNAPGAPPAGAKVVAGSHQPARAPDKTKSIFMAAIRPPGIGESARRPPTEISTPPPTRIEDTLFNGKKSYSMSLNMPNLASSGGSWIIHFAQLDKDEAAGDITAPVATTKVDPAYPAQLMHDGIEGTVILYAVIHKDGSVGEVRVLRGLEGHLDENARLALLRWKFRPGTKNGQAVDLEAVVQIPYKAGRMEF